MYYTLPGAGSYGSLPGERYLSSGDRFASEPK